MQRSKSSFIHSESFAGILLFIAAVIAMVANNSWLASFYDNLLHVIVAIHIENFSIRKPLFLWINDGLMAIFFLLVGLEIKRELFKGMLRHPGVVLLPAMGALGGLIAPAIIYAYINWHDPIALQGWGIPVATDIAFSLGILALLGSRIPSSLKIFLTALAIIDDIAAIVIIAVFYTAKLSYTSLALAAVAILILILMNRLGVKRLSFYIIVGLFLWVSVLKSGVHATLAGIVLAFAIPLGDGQNKETSLLVRTEYTLLPWVSFLVLPLFAFANSGFSLAGLSVQSLIKPIPLGIAAGLFIGKQLGIFSTCWILIKTGIAKMPEGMNYRMLYAVSILCGVGFTMSLFIGSLALTKYGADYNRLIRLGVLTGSLLSGICGYTMLRLVLPKKVSG